MMHGVYGCGTELGMGFVRNPTRRSNPVPIRPTDFPGPGCTRRLFFSLPNSDLGVELRDLQQLAAFQGGLVADDAGGGVSHGFVDIHGGLALLENGGDELVGDETVGARVAAVVPERFGQQIGFPPLHFLVMFRRLGEARKASDAGR